VAPLSLVHKPRPATPATSDSEPGTGVTIVSVPHSDSLYARLPVPFSHTSPVAACRPAPQARRATVSNPEKIFLAMDFGGSGKISAAHPRVAAPANGTKGSESLPW